MRVTNLNVQARVRKGRMMSEGGAEGKSSGVRVPFLSQQHTSSGTTGKKEVMMRTGFAKSYAPSRHPTDSKKHFSKQGRGIRACRLRRGCTSAT